MNTICCLSYKRSGSSLISTLLGKSQLLNIYSHGEILTNFEIPQYMLKLYKKFSDFSPCSDIFHVKVDSNPKQFFDIFKLKNRYSFINAHTDNLKLNTKKYILKNNNIFKVFTKRDLLESYVSDKKAQLVNKYDSIDTTNIKITIDIEEFLTYVTYRKSEFYKCISYLDNTNQKYCILDYNEYKDFNNKDKVNYIVKNINSTFDTYINYTGIDFNISLFKQDKSKLSETITNYDDISTLEWGFDD